MKKKKNDNEILDEERKTQDAGAVAEYNGEKSNRAKVVEYMGDDYKDVPVKDDSFLGRAGNFFYHYKWHLIIGAIFLVIGVVGIWQMATSKKTNADISVMYAGPERMGQAKKDDITAALEEMLGEEEKKNVYLNTFYYNPYQEVTNATGNSLVVSDKGYAGVDLQGTIATGECGAMFIDKTLFDVLKEEGGLEKLEDGIGYLPDGAFDEYGVRLEDTAAYQNYEALRAMPGDTVVCMRSLADSMFTSKRTAKEYYDNASKLLSAFFAIAVSEPVDTN